METTAGAKRCSELQTPQSSAMADPALFPDSWNGFFFDTEPELCPSSQCRGCGVNERQNKHVRGQPRGRSQAVPSRMGSTRQGRAGCVHATPSPASAASTRWHLPKGCSLGLAQPLQGARCWEGLGDAAPFGHRLVKNQVFFGPGCSQILSHQGAPKTAERRK